MKKLILTFGLMLAAVPAFALPKPVVTCKSIDVTYRPFYTINVYQFDVTHPGYYGAVIEKVVDFAGTRKEIIRKEGPRKGTKDEFSVEFGEYNNGRFIKSGDDVSVRRLANGYLKGEMNLSDDRAVELTCKSN